MERLTDRFNDGTVGVINICDNSELIELDSLIKDGVELASICGAIDRLAEYEDLQEECIYETGCGLEIIASKNKEFLDDMHRLIKYDKAEEQGLLLKLPCKVGDTLWLQDIITKEIVKGLVRTVVQRSSRGIQWDLIIDEWNVMVECGAIMCCFNVSDFGKTVFLTKEEAEDALKRLEG